MRVEELVESLWKETWDIIRVSDAYKQGLPIKECKPMLETLFEAAMFRLMKSLIVEKWKCKRCGKIFTTEQVHECKCEFYVCREYIEVECPYCGCMNTYYEVSDNGGR